MRSIRFVLALAAVATLAGCASGGASSASTSAMSTATPVAGAIDAASAPFVGSKKSKKFYPSACQTVKLIKAQDQVGFGSMKDAEAAGFVKDVYSTDCRY